MSPLPSTGVRLTVRGPVTLVHIPIALLQRGIAALQHYHDGYQCQRIPQRMSRPGRLTIADPHAVLPQKNKRNIIY